MIDHGRDGSAASHDSACTRVAWWCQSTDLRVASVRMRAALVMRLLSQRGVATEWFRNEDASRYRCVIASKPYSDGAVRQLRRFKQNGGRFVLDLCDNGFLPATQKHKHLHKVESLRTLVDMADTVVTASEELAQIVAQECPTARRIVEIGDMPDDLSVVDVSLWRRYWNNWQSRRERNHLNNVAPAGVTRILWFGNSGGIRKMSGLADLARIAPMVADLSQIHPLHLTVISNSVKLYREHVASALPSSRYIEWNATTFDSLLRQQHIVIIPSSPNGYARCKSDNRVVTALRAGLAVVAEPVPSYLPYDDVIRIGSIEAGLRHYLADPAKRNADATRGQIRVRQAGQAERVLAQWIDACGL